MKRKTNKKRRSNKQFVGLASCNLWSNLGCTSLGHQWVLYRAFFLDSGESDKGVEMEGELSPPSFLSSSASAPLTAEA
jgi:hypothetical protein